MSKLRTLLGIAVLASLGACDQMTGPEPLEPQLEAIPAASAAQPGHAVAAKRGTTSIVGLAEATPALSTLVSVIGVSDAACGTNFESVLSGSRGQFTVFAPTNGAFDALIADLGAATVLSCDVLPTVLAFHVTRGRHHSQSVLSHDRFRMLSGEWAEVEGATIAGAPLNLGLIDISASNGIVHVVDAVLLPGSILAALAE